MDRKRGCVALPILSRRRFDTGGRRGVWVADMRTTLVVSMDIMRTSYSMHTRVGASTKFSTTLCTSRSMDIRRNILLAIMHNM